MANSVVYQESANNFTDNNQTIMGQAIVSVQFAPNPPEGIPTRIGVLHIQIPEGAEDKKLHAWLSLAGTPNNEWVPMLVGAGGGETPEDVVRTTKENDFTVAKQTIGENQIVTIIDGGANSVPSGTADFDGQVFFSYRNLGTDEAQGAIWVAKGNQWLPVASGGGSIDDDTIARTDRSNTFTDLQKIGSKVNMATFTSGRRTHLDPLDAATPDMMPFAAGDTIIREYNDGAVQHEVYIATEGSDADSWLKIYDSTNNTIQLEADIVALDGRLDTLSDKLDLEITDLDNLSKTVGDLDLAMTGVEGDIDLVGDKVNLLEPRVRANETKIAALETHFKPDGKVTELEGHFSEGGRVADIETNVASAIGTSNANTTAIETAQHEVDALTTKVAGLTTRVTSAEASILSTEGDVGTLQTDMITVKGYGNKITQAEADIVALETLTTSHTTKISDLEDKVPATLAAKKYLVVNEAGDGVELSAESTDDVEALAALGAGVVTGNALLSTKCLGGDTVLLFDDSNAAQTSRSNFIFGQPTGTKTYVLGDIVPYDSADLSGNKVREGCVITVVNAGAGIMRLDAEGTARFQTRDSDPYTYDIPSRTTVMFHPQIWEGGAKRYNVIAIFPNHPAS